MRLPSGPPHMSFRRVDPRRKKNERAGKGREQEESEEEKGKEQERKVQEDEKKGREGKEMKIEGRTKDKTVHIKG